MVSGDSVSSMEKASGSYQMAQDTTVNGEMGFHTVMESFTMQMAIAIKVSGEMGSLMGKV